MQRFAMLAPAALVALAGCVGTEEKQAAIEKVNAAFRECYEETLRVKGKRHYDVAKARAMDAATLALEGLGMTVVSADAATGYVRARAPAPSPLSDAEWKQAVDQDGPRLRSIVAGEVGIVGYFVEFEPQGLDVLITLTGVESSGGTDLAATMRMVERTPPPSGWPRREYPPCHALDAGVDKLWQAVDRAM